MIYLKVLFAALVGYLLGSVSFATIIAKLIFKKDLSREGSGNLGATNVFRVLGRGPATLVLAGDILKGLIAVAIASHLFPAAPTLFSSLFAAKTYPPSNLDSFAVVLASMAAIVGHVYPIFFGFKGGKGVAVSLGVLIGLMPKVGAVLVIFWLTIFTMSGYVSLGSILAAAAFPFATVYLHSKNIAYITFSLIVSVMVIYKHRTNIDRLLKGKESRFGKRKG